MIPAAELARIRAFASSTTLRPGWGAIAGAQEALRVLLAEVDRLRVEREALDEWHRQICETTVELRTEIAQLRTTLETALDMIRKPPPPGARPGGEG